MTRDILHLAIPAYPIAVARVVDPALRQRPVVIAPGLSDRAIIQSVSAEAASDGVISGMTVGRGRSLCPSLLALPPDPRLLARADHALNKLISQYSPITELQPAGRLFIDLTGSRRLFGPGRDVAIRLEKELENSLRLSGTLGVAANKLVSRIAASCLERPGVCDVLRGSEQSFLAPLPVNRLPGIGSVREKLLLRELNLRHIGELAALNLLQLKLVFGPFAPLVQQRAQGRDLAPVTPPRKTPKICAEGFLEREENNTVIVRAELCRLVEECGMQLRQINRATSRIQLTIHYADGVSASRDQYLSPPQNHDLLLYEIAKGLFTELCVRRVRIKGLKLSCRDFDQAGYQASLFDIGPSLRQQSLQQTIDQLRNKHGMRIIQRGQTLASCQS